MFNANESNTEESRSEIDPIRVELLSTEMPIHQLAKRGGEAIRILKRKPGGRIELQWSVDYSTAAGTPGQLAYRLDTWVIKRRLDKLRKPIPRLIEIGDLRKIARELNHGGDTNAVRRAFDQNAATFIRAKITYRTADKQGATLEGYFSRYNVFYRGHSLPGGRRAETVYISLNDPYYDLVREGKARPLDLEYQRSLTPSAQRFYEIISRRIYAALKNSGSTARIRYSDYCQYAAQKPQSSRSRMQAQMAAVHRPHRESGYIAEVKYRRSPNPEGNLDWIIEYTPGDRAKSEYARFNERHGPRASINADPEPAVEVKRTPPPSNAKPDQAEQLARCFLERRNGRPPGTLSPRQIGWGRQLLDAADQDVEIAELAIDLAVEASRKNRDGFPAHVGGLLDAGFVDQARVQRDQESAHQTARDRSEAEERSRHQFDDWRKKRARDRISQLSDIDRQRLVTARTDDVSRDQRFFLQLQSWPAERERAWLESQVLRAYGHEGEPSFEEWRRCEEDPPLH
ncbi:MAG: hypothetical protein HKN10_16050 [Myxococcales bacterium]|nr:hypothetical protein [Myxococcales bacterium]